MNLRHQNRHSIEVLHSMDEYGKEFLWTYTDDELVYNYQKRLRWEMQSALFKGMPFGIAFASIPYFITR